MSRFGGCLALILLTVPASALGWGEVGHKLVNRAAARGLPGELPPCLRRPGVAERLAYLGPEPDRWRIRELEEMARAGAPEHFLDLELLEGIVDPQRPPGDRLKFAEALRDGGQDPAKVGLAPYVVIELCQRIEAAVVALARIDPARPGAGPQRQQAEEVLVYACGVLGHYVADLANPHHTTIHYNGWRGENPAGYRSDRRTHARFESRFVSRVERQLQVAVQAPLPAHPLRYDRAVWGLIQESNELVPELYRLDRDGAFDPGQEESQAGRAGLAFAQARLVRGATLLRDLWVSACRNGLARAEAERLRSELRRRFATAGLTRVQVDVRPGARVRLRGRLTPAERRRVGELLQTQFDIAELKLELRVAY